MSKKLTGNDVYLALCDLDLTLQDINVMVGVKMFLNSIPPDSDSLVEFNKRIKSLDRVLKRLGQK